MKKILSIFFVFCFCVIGFSQNYSPFPMYCVTPDNVSMETQQNQLGICGTNSPYYSNSMLYLPQLSDGIIYLKLNLIILTKPDGTGNFQQNNPEHVQALNDAVASANYRLLNLSAPEMGCIGYGEPNQTSTKIQLVVNKIWRIDPAWDYLYTGYVPCYGNGAPVNCINFNKVNPSDATNYYYGYYDSDPSIPEGINIILANNGALYNEIVNNHNFTAPGGEGWAASQTSSNTNFDQDLREFFPNVYLDYFLKRYYVADNPDPNSPYPNTPWSTVYWWFVGVFGGGLLHETGHSFNLGHQSCWPNMMQPKGTSPRNYLSNMEIAKLHYASSTTSIRKYFTEDSFKNTSIHSDSNQLWNLNFRLYSNVEIGNNSSLKATCKIIMAPESRIIVRSGSNFIIEGADISSANNQSWNGIKIEGNGYGLILPDTKIDNGYFYMYADNTILPSGKTSTNGKSFTSKRENNLVNTEVENIKIYPNPTGDYINIQTNGTIKSANIFNLEGKNIKIFNNNLNRIDVHSLPTGSYILRIDLMDKSVTKKFIKK